MLIKIEILVYPMFYSAFVYCKALHGKSCLKESLHMKILLLFQSIE